MASLSSGLCHNVAFFLKLVAFSSVGLSSCSIVVPTVNRQASQKHGKTHRQPNSCVYNYGHAICSITQSLCTMPKHTVQTIHNTPYFIILCRLQAQQQMLLWLLST